jgi:hypothetical protein
MRERVALIWTRFVGFLRNNNIVAKTCFIHWKRQRRARAAHKKWKRLRLRAVMLMSQSSLSHARAASIVLDNLRAPAVDPFHACQSFSNCAGVVVARPRSAPAPNNQNWPWWAARTKHKTSTRRALQFIMHAAEQYVHVYTLGSNFLIAISLRRFFSCARCLSWTPGLTKLSTAAATSGRSKRWMGQTNRPFNYSILPETCSFYLTGISDSFCSRKFSLNKQMFWTTRICFASCIICSNITAFKTSTIPNLRTNENSSNLKPYYYNHMRAFRGINRDMFFFLNV